MIDIFSEKKSDFDVIRQEEIDELYKKILKSRAFDALSSKSISIKEYEKIQKEAYFAKEKLIASNIKFIIKVSKKYFMHYDDIEEAINEGTIGLLDAIEKYDPKKTRFVTYIYFYIEKYVLMFVRKKNAKIKLPYYMIDLSNKAAKTKQEFENNNTHCTDEMIAKKLGISVKKYKNVVSAHSIKELNYSIDNDNSKFSDFDDMATDRKGKPDLHVLHEAVSKLKDPEKTIIEEFYGFNDKNKSIHHIALKLNMSSFNVKTIKEAAEEKIKNIIKDVDFGDSYGFCSSHRHIS